ncbi:MAG TPA: hypothetical protein VK842_09110 [bacterium]|nr:hypothetical protein [bacterium]
MTRMLLLLGALCLGGSARPAWAADAAADLSPAAGDDGMYYAPVDDSPAAQLSGGGSLLTRARISPFAWGSPGRGLDLVEIYVDGNYLGRTPLSLGGMVVDAAGVSLGARAEGYEDALRPRVRLPDDGPVAVAMLPSDAAWPVTTPGWALGLGLVAAGMLVYRSDAPATGLSLAAGGLLSVGLTQLWARWVSMPALRARVDAYNASPDPEPRP